MRPEKSGALMERSRGAIRQQFTGAYTVRLHTFWHRSRRTGVLRSIAVLALLMLSTAPCWGRYSIGYADWQSLSREAKNRYVAAILDFLVQKIVQDGSFYADLSRALEQCRFGGWKISEPDIADDVDRLYEQNIGLHKESPAIVIYVATIQRCQEPINEYMRARDKTPPSASDLIRDLSRPVGSRGSQ